MTNLLGFGTPIGFRRPWKARGIGNSKKEKEKKVLWATWYTIGGLDMPGSPSLMILDVRALGH